MVMAFDLSVRLGLLPAGDAARVRRHFEQSACRHAVARRPALVGRTGSSRIWGSDKKVRDGRIAFILARGIGQAFIARDVAPEAVRMQLDAAIAA